MKHQKIYREKIKSPLNYIGGKGRILDQIIPLFPKKIENFIDLFAGGCNVGINITAEKIYFNDNLTYLIDMYRKLRQNNFETTIDYIENRISEYDLNEINEKGFKEIRSDYNTNRNPLDLFILIAYSFNHQIRFNNKHDFNNSFGRNRSSFNSTMKNNLLQFIACLKEKVVVFTNNCFTDFDYSFITPDDFVYVDPPYLITTGSYNDGKRGFKGWSIKEEKQLLNKLDSLDERNIKWALSNVLIHKGKSNETLENWLNYNNRYETNVIDFNYSNSNYQTIVRDKKATVEVLITNYKPENVQPELPFKLN